MCLTEQRVKLQQLRVSKNNQITEQSQLNSSSSFDLLCSIFSFYMNSNPLFPSGIQSLKLNICMCQHIIKLCTWPYWPDLLNPLPQYNILTPSVTQRLHSLCINSLGTRSFISNLCLIKNTIYKTIAVFNIWYWKICSIVFVCVVLFCFFKETLQKNESRDR